MDRSNGVWVGSVLGLVMGSAVFLEPNAVLKVQSFKDRALRDGKVDSLIVKAMGRVQAGVVTTQSAGGAGASEHSDRLVRVSANRGIQTYIHLGSAPSGEQMAVTRLMGIHA